MATATKAKNVSDWKNLHDTSVIVPRKLRAALDAMKKEGRENWEYEGDLVKRAGVAQNQIPAFRELFKDHIVVTPSTSGKSPRNVWFADAKVAASIRGE
jgi:hypothetical protein